MKQLYLLCVCGLVMQGLFGQNLSLNTLMDYSTLSFAKFENSISKKGYRKTDEQSKDGIFFRKYQWFKKGERKYPHDFIGFCSRNNNQSFICFETADRNIFAQLENDLKQSFHYPVKKESLPLLFQKENIRVQVTSFIEDSITKYRFAIERKDLPKVRDLVYAEDLLKVTSHEYLATLFGETNVLKDIFYFSEKELNKCSILYPNTNKEVIFVWKDEENYSDISFLVIGGHIQTQNTMHYDNQIEQNVWHSNQGIYTGMSLSELQTLNGGELKFYGWQSDFPGAVMPHTTGKINFERIGCILNCLNCSGSTNYQKKVINSDEALADERKIYVTTMMILPEKIAISKM
jgi:hypothetical protein